MHVTVSLLATATILVLLTACDKSSEQSQPAASASAEQVQPAAPKLPPPPPPADIDLGALEKSLGCSGRSAKSKGTNACRVVEQFAQAQRFTGDTPSGVGRWFGRAYVVEKGEEKLEYLMLRSRRVPTARVGPGELALMIGREFVAEELRKQAVKLVMGLNQGSRGKKKNLAFREVEAFEPKQERGAVNTKGQSVQLVSDIGDDSVYLRQQTIKRVFMVQTSAGKDAKAGDGVYAELWLVVW
jgi:hypothetical protein